MNTGAQIRSFMKAAFPESRLLKQAEPVLNAIQSFLIFPDPNGMYAHCMINYLH